MSDQPYETGYGKPPKHGQFVKGKSGNPKGRPKGSKNLSTIFQETVLEKVPVMANGATREMSKFAASVMQLVNKAAAGDMRALNMLPAWLRMFQEVGDETEKSNPLATEDDKALMASMLKELWETRPKKEENEE